MREKHLFLNTALLTVVRWVKIELMRSLDWSQTLLDTVKIWSQSLQTILSLQLVSRHPILRKWLIGWMNDFTEARETDIDAELSKPSLNRYLDYTSSSHSISSLLQEVMLTSRQRRQDGKRLLVVLYSRSFQAIRMIQMRMVCKICVGH